MRALVLIVGCLVPALFACGSSGTSHGEEAKLVRPEELPERQREVLAAWRRGGAEWETERERVRSDPELARFLVDNLIVEMVRAFDRSAIATATRLDGPFDRAQAELVRWADKSTPVLVELLGVRDGIVAYLAADTLGRIGAPAVAPTAGKLAAEDPEVRRRAAELLGDLPAAPEADADVVGRLGERVERDEAWIVRAQAARALGSRGSRIEAKAPIASVLMKALADADVEVRKSALGALGALGEERAAPAMIRELERAAREGDLACLQAAQTALRRLLHEDSDHDPDAWWDHWKTRSAH